MKNYKLVICAILIAVGLLLIYTVHFFGVSLSDDSSDWGAFGNYMGIGISAVSIVLIYITYDEQRSFNKIARFEQRFITMTNTLEGFGEKNKEELKLFYQNFCKHFQGISGIDEYERKKTANVLPYYYSMAMIVSNKDYAHIFRYLNMCVAFVRNSDLLTDKEKESRITELSCIVSEPIRVFYLCWLISNDKSCLKKDYESGLFLLEETTPELLRDVIMFVCIDKQSTQTESVNNNKYELDLEKNSEEQFCDTYNRLYNQ